jgi:hypothetical protein
VSNSAGNASNQLNQPTDVALVHPNLIYISDYNNHRVQQYQLGSSTGMTVAGQANGLGGSSLNQLNHPTCIFVDSSDGIFVSDSDNNRIQYWSNGASTGTTVAGSSTGESTKRNKEKFFARYLFLPLKTCKYLFV